MTRNTKIVKKITALFLVLLLSIDSFAAIISENDGSAFVTKAEFEAMKSNFNNQIDNYNTSIDSKIDGAIASYLSGINVAKPFVTYSNINEIKYPLRIVHHMKSYEECDDSVTTSQPQLAPLWAPKWNLMTVNVRGIYRVLDKFVIPNIDNVSKFVGGINEDTTDNGDFKAHSTTQGFQKTCNMFFQIDGWGTVNDSGEADDNNLLAYSILADDSGNTRWAFNYTNAWENRSAYVVSDYNDLEKYNELDADYSITTASSMQTRAANLTHTSFQDNFNQWKCDNMTGYMGPNHTSRFDKSGMSQDLGNIQESTNFDIIYNNNDGNALAPVTYYNTYTDGKKWDLYYTNKSKNRILYNYNSSGIEHLTWGFWDRNNNDTAGTYGIVRVLTRGYNLESELENTARAWYNKSLIKQSRIKYDFNTSNKKFEDHRMGNGIPLYYFDSKELNTSEINEVEINFKMETTHPSNKKYIFFSKKPITVNNYAENVDSNTDFEVIKAFNGTKYTATKRKLELVNGNNIIKLGDFIAGETLYYKILWDTTLTKSGTNYDDEYIDIKDLELEITS